MNRLNSTVNVNPGFSSLTFLLLISTLLLFVACNPGSSKNSEKKPVTRDTTITKENAFLNVFLDSTQVTSFLEKAKLSTEDSTELSDFYKSRNYEFAWFDNAGLTEHATSFVSLYRNYRSANNDSSLRNKKLDNIIDNIMDDSAYLPANKKEMIQTELELSKQFFKYAGKAYGNNLDPEELGWFIPKKKINIRSFLDSIISNKKASISDFEPVHPMFSPLHEYLEKYTAIEKKNGWPVINFLKKNYKEGDSAEAIGMLKKRLQLIGDLEPADTGNVFSAATKKGVINFQHRYGQKEDGVVTAKMIQEINRPITEKIKQIIVNIERIKWIPKPGTGRYIVANIPAYRLYVFDSGRYQWGMNVVVGSQANSTVIFSDILELIVFSPYWNVPYSIVKNEMAGKSASYFERNNFEIVGKYSDGLPQVRQKPGPRNSLGRVKFLFPNSYSIYFHDTPAKGLFNQTNRAASHGCIRLAEPAKMASWLLDYDPNWTTDSIQKSMALTKEKTVKLKKPVPVFIGYFTAWVDQQGKLNFRDDIYGHDKKMMERLF
ncbi:MAG: L,D-transpeptidase family protein [Bacteroidota bacterium]